MNIFDNYMNKTFTRSLPKRFKEIHTFEKRLTESKRILSKYPERVPVICEKYDNNPEIPNIDRKKYLVPNDLTMGQFVFVIRKRLKLPPEKSIYLFINETIIPHTNGLVNHFYHDYKDKDGFLYICYSGENTFG